MAKLSLLIPLLISYMVVAGAAGADASKSYAPEVMDPQAVDAMRKYWSAFESYEYSLLKDGENKFNEAWLQVKKSYQQSKVKLTAAELDALQKSAQNYRNQLTSHQVSDTRPYVMLNLAQILALIGDHQSAEDPDAGTFARSEALAILKDLDTGFKYFTHREQAVYLRASILATMGRDDEALALWRVLSQSSQPSIYVVHARIAVADAMYKKEQPAEATRYYQKALEMLPSVGAADPDYERIRLDYRLGWAAYRATELSLAIQAATDLLSPQLRFASVEQKKQIQKDAVDLIGDSIYEQNSADGTSAVLKRPELKEYVGAISLRTIKKHFANGNFSQAVELGESAYQMAPLARETPEILQIKAEAYGKLGKQDKRLQSLESLAQLLPSQSLWRSRHKSDLVVQKAMELSGKRAAELVALSQYDNGLASGNGKLFVAAASLYELLSEEYPNDDHANEWRLRRAHCAYFSDHVDEAAKLYAALKTEYKVSPEILQIASYQLVLTNEKRWRDTFAKAVARGDDPYTDGQTITALTALEKSIDEFSSRFAGQSRAVDLLLVGASTNRDMNRLSDASRYWQRVLVSQPVPAQRGLAVRGLILTAMKIGSPAEVVDACRRYLKLEDWQALGLTIAVELNGVLSAATFEQAKLLVGSGKALEAGDLMVGIAQEFPKVPERERIFRDGAYQFAIGGDWSAAEKAAQSYLQAGLPVFRADMIYLLARAEEYQLRLHESAKSYAELAEKFPSHVRSATSAIRAERLAVAEADYALAARAATLQAERATSEPQKRAHYSRAAEYLDKDGDPNRALQIARKGQRSSRTAAERFRAELQVARLTFKTGSEQEALDDLLILAKQIDKSAGKMSSADFAALSGEVHVMLGDEARRQFEDFNITTTAGDITGGIEKKTEYFANLTAEYDKAAAAGDPRWASEARYQIGAAAELLADQIAAIPARNGEQVTLKAQSRYNATIQRLQTIAQKYHSGNVLAARKNPAAYNDNQWVNKSSLRVAGAVASESNTRHKDIPPTAMQATIPSDWSL